MTKSKWHTTIWKFFFLSYSSVIGAWATNPYNPLASLAALGLLGDVSYTGSLMNEGSGLQKVGELMKEVLYDP